MIVRWGGEEFLAFLPTMPRVTGVDEIARRLLNGISEPMRVEYQGAAESSRERVDRFRAIPAGARTSEALPWERAVNLVDMALYMAKGHGRNRAYGVRGFAEGGTTTIEQIEQDLEQAWRSGAVDMSVVLGSWTDGAAVPAAVNG